MNGHGKKKECVFYKSFEVPVIFACKHMTTEKTVNDRFLIRIKYSKLSWRICTKELYFVFICLLALQVVGDSQY